MIGSILLSIIIFSIVFPILLNRTITLNLTYYISVIVLIYISLIYSLIMNNIPFTLLCIIFLLCLYLIFKHKVVFADHVGRRFVAQSLLFGYRFILFTCACAYISTSPILVINSLFLWITMIAVSAVLSFVIYLVWTSAYAKMSFTKEVDLIMVLGAGIFTEDVTPMLRYRLNRALAIYKQQVNQTYILVSGGQGPDEPISEALAMKRYLIKQGVQPEDIIMENQSTNTYTNFSQSQVILSQRFITMPNMICVTSQFHILRALRIAQKSGVKTKGIGSHTPYHFFFPVLVKDFLGVMYQYKLLLTLYFATLFIISMLKPWL
ncbi:YdcF family protein [Staphylococcus simiae]|uniref:YdcF family protein n=1 Tax=Staphylococcus simiae TaxID=308354 RepID=UPI001A969CF2|nr:YdcF family protein [Staphylococcus simiae]MBO1198671.1 YdcF family protein [Staphylococcus simiae]MBO1200844.1 YdcF family protein [Staphylococcus simiae]MBO1203052.1 YdcF family protein [Staphylococcus simiae]MBO1211297.1 YdcF family protein [Staphylococcus simiae]MBO1229180.1 YdcF family protein [Staphylococcus simiae]